MKGWKKKKAICDEFNVDQISEQKEKEKYIKQLNIKENNMNKIRFITCCTKREWAEFSH